MKDKLKMAATGCRILQFPKQCFLFYRNFLTNLGNNLGRHAAQTEEETHIYKQPMNSRDVIDHFVKNVTFENEDWIVTNKPYGVGLAKPINFIPMYSARTFTDVYMKEILPLLAEEFKVNALEVLFLPERFTSGVTVLGKTPESIEKYKKYNLRNIERKLLQYTFIAVTMFEPLTKFGEKKFKLRYNKEKKVTEIINKKKESTGTIINCRHQVIDSSKLCSLVKVEANKVVHNCVSEYLKKVCLSPVLGEVSFNSSVMKIGDVSFLVAADGPIRNSELLDSELLSSLKLHKNEISLIPKHLHLKSLNLKMEKNEEFFVSVPPPATFSWTCEQLNLSENKSSL